MTCPHTNLDAAPAIGWQDDGLGNYLELVNCECKSTRARCAVATVRATQPGPLTRYVRQRLAEREVPNAA
jgi:hypothetical protein